MKKIDGQVNVQGKKTEKVKEFKNSQSNIRCNGRCNYEVKRTG